MNKYSQRPSPPRWADRLLEWFLPDELRQEVQGDLREMFKEQLLVVGERKARSGYVLFVMVFLRSCFKIGEKQSVDKTEVLTGE